MAYGFECFDANGVKIIDSTWPVFALERIVTLYGSVINSSYSLRYKYSPFNPLNPTEPMYSSTLLGYPQSHYDYSTTSVLAGDPTAASALLAFEIPAGSWAFHDEMYDRVRTSLAQSSIRVAVLKPASLLGIGPNQYGAAAYDTSGNVTWSAYWPVVRIQGAVGNKTIEASNWFVLNGNQRRRVLGGLITSGAYIPVGVKHTSATTIETVSGLYLGTTQPLDTFGADTQDTPGLVLYNINV